MKTAIRTLLALAIFYAVLTGVLWAQSSGEGRARTDRDSVTQTACDPYRDPQSCKSPTTPPAWNPYASPPAWPLWLPCEDARVLEAGLGGACSYAPGYRDVLVRGRACEPGAYRADCTPVYPVGVAPAILYEHIAYTTPEGWQVRVVGMVWTVRAEVVYVVRVWDQDGLPLGALPWPQRAGMEGWTW